MHELGMKQLLALLLLMTVSLSSAHSRPFRSIKAPIETINNYAIVLPTVTFMDSNKLYPNVFHVTVANSMGTFYLVLEKNELLIHPNFVSRYYDDDGNEAVVKGQENCYYHGYVKGHPHWIVTMTTCHGLQGEFGDPSNESSFYHIEPLDREDKSLDQSHALYLDKEYKMKEGGCGSNDSFVLNNENSPQSLQDQIKHLIHRRQTVNGLRFVELVVVNDYRQYTNFRKDLGATVRRALAIVNGVDNLYKSLSIRIILVESITWTNGNRIQVVGDPKSLLYNFKAYKNQISVNHDTALLLTGRDLYGQTVGIAFTGSMCNEHTSVGLTQDNGRNLQSVVTTAAHEIGHLFSMTHDDSSNSCSCGDASGRCIMGKTSWPPLPTRWSTCSINNLNKGIRDYNLDNCLFNEPTRTVGGPECGNGIRDGNEACDCGSPDECTDPCCNARTCQFIRGAECSAGKCCTSGCRFKAYGSQCRGASGECDIAEYCSGNSGECATDEHKLDDISCNNNKGYCYSGHCPTHDDQCQVAFKSRKASNNCYNTVNTRGDQYGNCGSTATAFIPCTQNNVQCGQLHCTEGELQRSAFSSKSSVIDLTFRIRYRTHTGTTFNLCRSFTTQPGGDTVSPGLVKEGTRCGTGRVCNAQKCVPVSTANPCSRGSNGNICSGKGTCNNRGKCSCNVGYKGSVCQHQTN